MLVRRILIGLGLFGSLAACSAILGIGDLPPDDATNPDASADGVAPDDGGPDDGSPGDGGPNPNAPRLLSPLSTSRVTSTRPTLRWVNPAGVTNVTIDLCSDRACTSPSSAPVTGTSYPIPTSYNPGVVFWRVRNGSATSATWEFTVGMPTTTADGGAPIDSSWGTSLDVNGDGYADVAVGSDQTGLISLFYGKGGGITAQADGGTPPSFTLTMTISGPLLYSIISGGDLNGDGYGDLVVGAGGGTSQVYLFFGSSSGVTLTPSITLSGPAGGPGSFGSVVASAGDVNGDGYADLLVSTGSTLGTQEVVYFFLGNAGGVSATPTTTLNDPFGRPAFGSAFGAGDMNGDGYSDVVIGNPGNNFTDKGGGAYFFLGGPDGLANLSDGGAVPSATLSFLSSPNGHFGSAIAAADFNGDGYVDFVVDGTGQTQNASVYYGGPVPLTDPTDGGVTQPNVRIVAEGAVFTSAGAFNADGYSDLAVSSAGQGIAVATGSINGLSDAVAKINPIGDGGQFGVSITSAGDIARDGRGNLLVGDPLAAGDAGQAYIYSQQLLGDLTTTPVPILNPITPGANGFGGHVGGATN